jgi:uncharacterized DUF497 family protein
MLIKKLQKKTAQRRSGIVDCGRAFKLSVSKHFFVVTIQVMRIEFDPTKNAANIHDRGLSFETAAAFEFDTAIIWQDTRKRYPETRFSALGLLDGRVYSLVFAETPEGIRVISFRKANKREVKRYETESRID